MTKLFETHKDLVWGAIIVLSILFGINVCTDPLFREVSISNPLFLILLIGTVIPFLISMASGFDTEKLIGASAIAIGIMLLANALGGHESLVVAEVTACGIGVLILFFTALSLSGSSSGKEKPKESEEGTKKTGKGDKSPAFAIGIIFLLAVLVYFAIGNASRKSSTTNTVPANISNQSNQASNNNSNSSQANASVVITNVNPKAAAGTGVKN